MRVLMVVPRFAPDVGGIERVVDDAARALTVRGHRVVVVTPSPRGRARRERVRIDGGSYEIVRARRSKLWHRELVGYGLWRVVRRESQHADLVHVHSYHGLAALVGVLARRGRPVVATLHYHGDGHNRLRSLLHRWYRPIGRWMVERAAVVVCNTSAEAALVERDFPSSEVVVVSNPVAVVERGEIVVDDGTVGRRGRATVLSVSRLEPYKRVDVLLGAAAAHDAFDLVVVGDGDDRDRLERLAAGRSNVRLCGRVDDGELASWWRRCDLVASASEDESFGIVVAQALASGVRCVASDIDAHRELVEVAQTGALVAGDDPADWGQAIVESLSSPEPEPAPGFHTPAAHAEGLERVYLAAVYAGSSPAGRERPQP